MPFKSGFVNIIGKPNAGKSTLMNALVQENLSIITSKAQTTRHRITGLLNGKDFQIVFSDTPGFLRPAYPLHQAMMRYVESALEDADLILLVIDLKHDKKDEALIRALQKTSAPVFVLLNKTDLVDEARIRQAEAQWQEWINPGWILPVSALLGHNIPKLMPRILETLPEHPPYYPTDELTDRPERFFVAEIIREKIFLNYEQEIPYSCEVGIESFKEGDDLVRIRALIYVNRKSQKPIVIGKGGEKLKKVGTEARIDIEKFLGKKVYLELYVKVKENWRNNPNMLTRLGYQ